MARVASIVSVWKNIKKTDKKVTIIIESNYFYLSSSL